jgi:hypothetical protein
MDPADIVTVSLAIAAFLAGCWLVLAQQDRADSSGPAGDDGNDWTNDP